MGFARVARLHSQDAATELDGADAQKILDRRRGRLKLSYRCSLRPSANGDTTSLHCGPTSLIDNLSSNPKALSLYKVSREATERYAG